MTRPVRTANGGDLRKPAAEIGDATDHGVGAVITIDPLAHGDGQGDRLTIAALDTAGTVGAAVVDPNGFRVDTFRDQHDLSAACLPSECVLTIPNCARCSEQDRQISPKRPTTYVLTIAVKTKNELLPGFCGAAQSLDLR